LIAATALAIVATLVPPPPAAPIPREPAALAQALNATDAGLEAAIARWRNRETRPPRDVTLFALYQQRIYLALTTRPALAGAALDRLPRRRAAHLRDTLFARANLLHLSQPRPLSAFRTGPPAPAAALLRYYRQAQRRYGVAWSVLAAVNFVESAFGRVRSASEAGARGPMQFLPATWRRYGMGGDIDDPHDAILGAANLLRHAGAPRDVGAALYAYNHSTDYVRAVRRFASRMRTDERMYLTYYAWQVYIRTPGGGVRRVTGPR
jgi:hypothetical protein